MEFGSGVSRVLDRKRRRAPEWLVEISALLALIGVACGIPFLVGFATWSDVHALKEEWTVKGPPCPVVAKPSPTGVGRAKPKSFEYGAVNFTRSFGAASCASIPDIGIENRENYRVCQFNNPGAVTVRTDDALVVFEPPPGQRATVTVRRGEVSCVIGGWFNLK